MRYLVIDKYARLLLAGILVVLLAACGSSSRPDSDSGNLADDINVDDNSDQVTGVDDKSTNDPTVTNMRSYIFGHSLILHATETDETTVPHWMYLLSQASGLSYSVAGQYGFLRNHANLPPNAQWGFNIVPSAWEEEEDGTRAAFDEVGFTTILLTAGNFIQYQPATVPYDGDNPGDITPMEATLDIIDWVNARAPEATIFIYENWPDMGGFVSGFPATTEEFAAYNNYTLNSFHQWWLDYHDGLMFARPDIDIKMFPVGPIIARLLTETNLRNIPIADLYEDDAPHGRPTIYFLAALITYMATYGVQAPADFQIQSDNVHPLVQQNYASTVDFIWTELQGFNDTNGNSRVW